MAHWSWFAGLCLTQYKHAISPISDVSSTSSSPNLFCPYRTSAAPQACQTCTCLGACHLLLQWLGHLFPSRPHGSPLPVFRFICCSSEMSSLTSLPDSKNLRPGTHHSHTLLCYSSWHFLSCVFNFNLSPRMRVP